MSANENIKVSVILPVYSVEAYIGRCIESLQSQTMQELEFIFVDDCSSDGSMAAVEAWAVQDERVRILRNEQNLGAGPSRNRGIEVARGEYLSFVDPDDYVTPNFYELLYNAAIDNGKHDIAKGRRQRVSIAGETLEKPTNNLNDRIKKRLTNSRPLWTAFAYDHWTAIYKRELFAHGDVLYGTSRVGQDTLFLLRVGQKTNDIVFADDAMYCYVYRTDSATGRNTIDHFTDGLESTRECTHFLLDRGLDDDAYEYIGQLALVLVSRFQKAMGTNPSLRNDFGSIVDGLVGILLDVPHPERLYEHRPKLERLMNKGLFTTLGQRMPSEGEIRISVILPVYNPGPGIHTCIESLCQQLLDGLEFIFVDECSSDGSMAAVEAWAQQDKRVRVLRNEINLGLGPSRNRGIEVARGDYLSFVDPKDYVSADFFEHLYAQAVMDYGHDIAQGVMQKMSTSGEVIEPFSNKHANSLARKLKRIVPLYRFTYGLWPAIYKRTLFEDGSVRYDTAPNGQGAVFLLRCCHRTNDFVFTQKAVYYYVVDHTGSATSSSRRVALKACAKAVGNYIKRAVMGKL